MMTQAINVDELDGVTTNDTGDRFIPAKHIGLCPFHELSRDGFRTSHWSISRGGRPVPDGVWTISIFRRDERGEVLPSLARDRWILPNCFSLLFSFFESLGDAERVREVHRALKLNER